MWSRWMGRAGRNKEYEEGIRRFDAGQFADAITLFEKALEAPRQSPLVEQLARFYLAESHRAVALAEDGTGDTEAIIAHLKVSLKLNPGYADLHYHLGSAYQRQGQPVEAIPYLRKAVEINPQYARALIQLSMALYDNGEVNEAFQIALEACEHERLSESLVEEAEAAYNEGDFVKARTSLVKLARSLQEDEVQADAKRAAELYRAGELEESVAEYRRALLLRPSYADWHNQLGVVLFSLNRNDEALVAFDKAIEINPRYVEAQVNRGFALLRLSRSEDALAAFITANNLDPEHTISITRIRELFPELKSL